MKMVIRLSHTNQTVFQCHFGASFRNLFLKGKNYFAEHYYRNFFRVRQAMQILVGRRRPECGCACDDVNVNVCWVEYLHTPTPTLIENERSDLQLPLDSCRFKVALFSSLLTGSCGPRSASEHSADMLIVYTRFSIVLSACGVEKSSMIQTREEIRDAFDCV